MDGIAWAEWFSRQIAEKGRPSYDIPVGKICGTCRHVGEHELTCKNPWDIVDAEAPKELEPS